MTIGRVLETSPCESLKHHVQFLTAFFYFIFAPLCIRIYSIAQAPGTREIMCTLMRERDRRGDGPAGETISVVAHYTRRVVAELFEKWFFETQRDDAK